VVSNIYLGTVVGSEIKTNRNGEDSVRMLSAELSEGADVQTVELVAQNGEQSNPLDEQMVVIFELGRAWKIAIAVRDNVEPDSGLQRGEKILYSLDANNAIKAKIYLKGDGTVVLNDGTDWAVQFTALKDAFDTLKSDLNGMISKWNTFATAYAPGGPAAPGTPPTADNATASTADMAGAKVTSVQLP